MRGRPSAWFRGFLRPTGAPSAVQHSPRRARAKYNRSTMENAGQIQCKSLKGRKKSRRRRNNGKQWKKQCAEQCEQSEIRARSTSGCEAGRQATALRASRCRDGSSLLAEFADEPGRNSLTRIYAISTNSERAQWRNSPTERIIRACAA